MSESLVARPGAVKHAWEAGRGVLRGAQRVDATPGQAGMSGSTAARMPSDALQPEPRDGPPEEKGSAAVLESPIAFGTRQPAPPIGFGIDLMNHNVGLLP